MLETLLKNTKTENTDRDMIVLYMVSAAYRATQCQFEWQLIFEKTDQA